MRIILLLGMGFISLKGFAGSSDKDSSAPFTSTRFEVSPLSATPAPAGSATEGTEFDDLSQKQGFISNRHKPVSEVSGTDENIPPNPEEVVKWLSRLNDKSSLLNRVIAVKDWKTVFHYNPNEIFSHLQLKLSDKSKKVREAAMAALREMAADPSHSNFTVSKIRNLSRQLPDDNENLFLEKMNIAGELFKYINLYTRQMDDIIEIHLIFEELDVFGIDQALEALYKMAENGISYRKNIKVQKAALQLLSTTFYRFIEIKLFHELFSTSKAKEQVSYSILKGIQIAVKGLTDDNPEMRSAVQELLKRTFQVKGLSDTQVLQIIPSMANEGLSHSDHKIKRSTIDFLLVIASFYPSLNSEIDSLLQERETLQSDHNIKIAIEEARKQLNDLNQSHSVCEKELRQLGKEKK